jgi:hypothetical protein
MEPLFFYKKAALVMAADSNLPSDSNQWSSSILDELLKQAPYVNSFSPMVQLDKIDSNKGYGFGMIKIESNGNSASIPIVIKDGKLSPLDVFFDSNGKGFPLSEERFNEVLLNPTLFGGTISAESAANKHLGNMLTPPWENLGGFQHLDQNLSFYEKTSMLAALRGTVRKEDVAKLASWVNSMEGKVCLDSAPAEKFLAASVLEVAPSHHTRSVKTAHVIQFRKSGDSYFVKVAAPNDFAPAPEMEVPQREVQEALPPQEMAQLEQEGDVTIQSPPNAIPPATQVVQDAQFIPAVNYGVYRVQTVTGKDNVGWVFPQVFTYAMQPLPVKLFADGRQHAIQQEITGVPVGQGSSLPNAPITGAGFFYLTKGATTVAFAPVMVKGTSVDPSGNTVYMCQGMLTGANINISLVPGVAMPMEFGPESYAIPPECGFMPLGDPSHKLLGDAAQATSLNSTEQQKQASGQVIKARVTTDGSVSLAGPALNGVEANFLKVAEAKFLLACMGVSPRDSAIKLANAYKTRGMTNFFVSSPITPRHFNKIAKSTQHIDSFIANIKTALYKEAAEVASVDPGSADAILSLSFLSADNLQRFISYLPQLQDAMSALANLLLASRLGLAQIPEDSCSNALKALDKAVQGLKLMQVSDQTAA